MSKSPTLSDLICGDVVRCGNPECDEELRKRPRSEADDIFEVKAPDDTSSLSATPYCSPRCIARSMAEYDDVDRVNVYDAGGVTPGGVTDDD